MKIATPIETVKAEATLKDVIKKIIESGKPAVRFVSQRMETLITVDDVAEQLMIRGSLRESLNARPKLRAYKRVSSLNVKTLMGTLKEEKYVAYVENGRISGVIEAKNVLKLFEHKFRLRHLGGDLPEALEPIVAPNTTISGAIKRIMRRKGSFLLVQTRGRVKGVVSLRSLISIILSPHFITKIEEGEDDFFYTCPLSLLSYETGCIVKSSEITRTKIVDTLSKYGCLVITRGSYLRSFYDDFSLREYLVNISGL